MELQYKDRMDSITIPIIGVNSYMKSNSLKKGAWHESYKYYDDNKYVGEYYEK